MTARCLVRKTLQIWSLSISPWTFFFPTPSSSVVVFVFLADSLSAQSSYSISSLGVPTTSLTPDKDITAENEQKKRGKHNLIMFAGNLQCVISSTSSHAKKKCTATGAVKCSPQALSEKRGNPLSIMLLSSLHTYSIKCLVNLLLYMCKSFTFCQRRGFHNKNLTPLTGSRRNWIPPGTKRSFTRARPATDSDKGCSDVVRTAFKSCCAGETMRPRRIPHHHRCRYQRLPPWSQTAWKFTVQHQGLPTLFFSLRPIIVAAMTVGGNGGFHYTKYK